MTVKDRLSGVAAGRNPEADRSPYSEGILDKGAKFLHSNDQ
jgi:hypothetical protein